MAYNLPCPSPLNGGTSSISMREISASFGPDVEGQTILLDSYYRGGNYVPDTFENYTIPYYPQSPGDSRTISLENFYCTNRKLYVYITSDRQNLNVKSLFTTSQWADTTLVKFVVINSGVNVYCNTVATVNSTSGYAMYIDNDFGGTLTLINYGNIYGKGGNNGGSFVQSNEPIRNQNDGGAGGNAIGIIASTSKKVSIQNNGNIYAGGGGGAKNAISGTIFDDGLWPTAKVNPPVGGIGGKGIGYGNSDNKGGAGTPAYHYISGAFSGSYGIRISAYGVLSSAFSGNGNTYYFGNNSYISSAISGDGNVFYIGTNVNISSAISGSGSVTYYIDAPYQTSAYLINGQIYRETYPLTYYYPNNNIPNFYSGADGGNWGQNGGNTPTNSGGLAGYYIVNNYLVDWLNYGSVLGRVG